MAVERGVMRAETEREITAAKDRALRPKHNSKELLQTLTDSEYRLC